MVDITNLDFNGATLDSRQVKPGMLFVAMKGERVDGHDFIPQALAAGAAGVIDGPDELAAAYEPFGDYLERPPAPVFRFDDLGGRKIAEVGRVLRGGDEMTVGGLVPGRDLRVVMRSSASQSAVTLHATGSEAEEYSFSSPLELVVAVDGREVCRVRCDLPENGFGDVAFVVPGAAIAADSVRIAFWGGHVAYAYWFYQ